MMCGKSLPSALTRARTLMKLDCLLPIHVKGMDSSRTFVSQYSLRVRQVSRTSAPQLHKAASEYNNCLSAPPGPRVPARKQILSLERSNKGVHCAHAVLKISPIVSLHRSREYWPAVCFAFADIA